MILAAAVVDGGAFLKTLTRVLTANEQPNLTGPV
jgi:hypothetical protein